MMSLRPTLPIPRRRPMVRMRHAASRILAYLRVHPNQLGGLLGVAALLLGLLLTSCARPDPRTAADLAQVKESILAGHASGARTPDQMVADLAALIRLGAAITEQQAKAAAIRMLEAAWGRVLDWGAALVGRLITGPAPAITAKVYTRIQI